MRWSRSRSCWAQARAGRQHQEDDRRRARLARRHLDRRHRRSRGDRRSPLYQGYRGLTKKFLEDSKTEEMSPRVEDAGSAGSGRSGISRAWSSSGSIGIFLIKAAVDYNPRKAVGLDGALAKLVDRPYGPLAARRRRRGPDRLRALLAERRALSQDLSGVTSRRDGHRLSIRELRHLGRVLVRSPGHEADLRHHRRRLRRIGWERALDPPAGGWAAGDPPATSGQRGRGADRRRAGPAGDRGGSCSEARSHVHLTGWHFSPDFELDATGRADRSSQPARGARRADRCARPRLGGRSAAALPPVARRRARSCATS